MSKKLIIISYDFPPLDGGIARLCQEIASGQTSYFNQVIVMTTDKSGESYTYNYAEIDRVEFPSKRGVCEYKMIQYLRNIKDKNNYVVLTATWHPEGLIGLLGGFKNVYFLGHGTEFLSGASWFRKNIWLRFYANFSLLRAKAVICNSSYTAALVKRLQTRSNTISLPLAVNGSFFKPLFKEKNDSGILKIATVSRVEKFKGHDFIARTIANLPLEFRNRIQWNIAGKGPDLEYVKDLVFALGLEDNVKFWGFVADERLPDFYNDNDVFLLCSRESKDTTTVEGFGLVFLEAQACGIPAIGTRTGGIVDAIEHENGGWLIAQDNEEELANILIRLCSDSAYLNLQHQKARRRVEEGFLWETYNLKLNNILTQNL